jgi:hypothetical protein
MSIALGVGVIAAALGGVGYLMRQPPAMTAAQGAANGAAQKSTAGASALGPATPVARAGAPAAKASADRRMLDSAVSNPSASAPLPAAGTPLKSELAELKARADAGDAAAASRLFQDMQTCAQVQRLNQFMPGLANRVLNDNGAASAPDAAQRSGRMLDFVQRNLDFTRNNAAMCADLSADDMANLVPATLQAAQMGDAQAANCYVGANLNNWPGLLDNPQWIQDYKSNALGLANSALQQGDWAMATLMAQAYGGNPRTSNMLNQLTGTNPAQAYTYAKLMSLGQPSGTPPSTRSTNALSNLSSQLSPDQIQAADAQAQQMYQQYFNATPRQTGDVANAMQACAQSGPG